MYTQIDTGSSTIFRFDNVMEIPICNMLCNEAFKLKGEKKQNTNIIIPWKDDDCFREILFKKNINEQISPYFNLITRLVNEKYNVNVKPVFIDMVIWRKGRKMPRHKDNGYKGPQEDRLRNRKISTVLYLNDNYTGGETFIKTEHGTDYISKPKQGTVVTFLSDETNEHGVNEITSGIRYTLPIWLG